MKENIIIVTLCGLFAAALIAFGFNYAAALDSFSAEDGRTAVMHSPAVTATTKPPVVAAEAAEVKPEPATATADLMDCRLYSEDKEVLFNTSLSSDGESLWFGSDETPFGDYIVSVNGGGKNCPTTVTFPLERGTYVIDGYKVVVK